MKPRRELTHKGFKRLQSEREFSYQIGLYAGVFYASMAYLFLYGTGCNLPPIVMIVAGAVSLLFLVIGGKIMKRIFEMFRWGRHVNMKFEAMAKFLKVKFVHIPEQYECQKTTE